MITLEQWIVEALTRFIPADTLNALLRDPQTVAVLLGGMIAVCGALLGSFLLLRGMSLTSDAISHTVLLGIVVTFMLMTGILGAPADLASPVLILGAAAAGVATVVLTELIFRSGLVKQDAALGLAFPLLFAIAVILVSRFVDDVHLDTDAVMVGEIGVAWADADAICLDGCQTVILTPDDRRAEIARQCVNCAQLGINPRDSRAEFAETCANCGEYSPAEAWQAGLLERQPTLVFFPSSLGVMGGLTLLTAAFVLVFFKELKLSTFDAGLARALGFRPGALHYALMIMVSLVAVGAFNAVGSILVIAFFIIPPAAAYLLTDRLSLMLLISPVVGAAGAFFGYDLARGRLFGVIEVGGVFAALNDLTGAALPTTWNSSISASMVLMMFAFFVAAWVLSPRYGLLAGMARRWAQRRRFSDMVFLGHVRNHEGTDAAADELSTENLHHHLRWTPERAARVLRRLRRRAWVDLRGGLVELTPRGREQIDAFRRETLAADRPQEITASTSGG
ncbi:MAG: metal ABC transporter permease [Anaerolineae bacterium]|nr:metal ABC transporter permease [Anaerolineae bacterium]